MEERIALLTDSTCDLSRDTTDRYGVKVVPLKIIYKDRQYSDREDIQPEDVYSRLPVEVPKTSTPSPFDVEQKLKVLKEEGFTHVLAVHISSGLSSTYSIVRMVAQEIKGLTVEVVDSRSLSMGLGLVVDQAAQWIHDRKMDFGQLVQKTRNLVPQTKGFFVLKTLEYLKQGGRIGAVTAALGEVLNLKPIIGISPEGTYYTHRKVRGRQQSLDELFKIAKEHIDAGLCRVAVMQGDAMDEAKAMLERIKGLVNVKDIVFTQISPAMVVHTGPGLVGVVIMNLK